MNPKKDSQLSAEEKDLLDSFERGEWKRVDNYEDEIAKLKDAAATSMRKDKRVNIRMSGLDLKLLQQKAAQEGLPYQTLISSVLHKYANGRLTG